MPPPCPTGPGWPSSRGGLPGRLGNSVATAGDVDGDGFSDVIVGAFQYSLPGQENEGRALAYLGSPSGLATEPAWKADGDQTRAKLRQRGLRGRGRER